MDGDEKEEEQSASSPMIISICPMSLTRSAGFIPNRVPSTARRSVGVEADR